MPDDVTRRRRWGDRKDGWRLRGQDPLMKIIPFFMWGRTGNQDFISDTLEIDEIEEYIRRKRDEGWKGFGLMHIFMAGYIRTLSQRPYLNRFVSGQRVFARNAIELCFNIKLEMTLESPETVLKLTFPREATLYDVYERVNSAIEEYRNKPANDVDGLSALLAKLPRPIMRLFISTLRTLDYFGKLPDFIRVTSPFHGSMYVTSMGSLGIPPIVHHLYDFGNVPLFLTIGSKYRKNELQDDGAVKSVRCVDICLTVDERICDGYIFASAYKQFKRIMRNPEVLESPPIAVFDDPEIDKKKG